MSSESVHDMGELETRAHTEARQSREAGIAISFEGVNHAFVGAKSVVEAVRDIDFDVPASQFLAVVGPSGCGKTTLLNMAMGMLNPSTGSVRIDEKPVLGPRLDVGYMLARDALLPWRTARKNIELALEPLNYPKAERHVIADEWLARVGLAQFGDAHIQTLSHGMRQRVAIARTLIKQPRCILMDEPFAALDAQTRTNVQEEFLRQWEKTSPTVVLITHDLTEAILLADRVVLMTSRPGQIALDLTIDLKRPRTDETRLDPEFARYYNEIRNRLSAVVPEEIGA